MNKFYISFLAICMSLGLNAQNVTKGAVFTTGGNFNAPGNHVKLYSYDLDIMDAWVVDSVLGDFSNYVITDGHYVYMHIGRGNGHPLGGDRIYKYDLLSATVQPIDSTNELTGFKKFEISGDRLIITRGYPATTDFVKVLDKNDLTSVLYSDTQIEGVCDGIAIANNVAYVASTNFSDSGMVNVIDLGATISNLGAYTLDSLSSGAKDIYFDNGMIYMTHLRYNPNYTVKYAGVTVLNLSDSTFTTDTTGLTNSTGFDYLNGLILGDFGNPLETYNVQNGNRNLVFSTYPTAAKFDPNSTSMLVQTTDYFSFGAVTLYDGMAMPIDTVDTDVAGSALAMVTNYFPTAVNDTVSDFSVAPDPIFIDALENDYDLDGDEIYLQTILKQPVSGTAVISNQQIEFTLQAIDFTDPDSIQYMIIDAWGDTSVAVVYLDFQTSVNEITRYSISSIYPNPANSVVNISSKNENIESIQVIDLSGKVLNSYFGLGSNFTMDVSNYTSGIYFMKVEINGQTEVHKLIVQ